MQPLDTPVTSVPHFIPNQVLTDTQLNAVVDYLEQQERFTRQRLIGIGIVCGFEPNLLLTGVNSCEVEISKGVGISSCGYLFNIPQDKITCDRWRTFHMTNYPPFNSPLGDPYDCIELVEYNAPLSAKELLEVSNLTLAQTQNKIVVLYLDIIDQPNGTCLGENCDEKGNSWVFKLRKLLIDVADMDKVIRAAYNPKLQPGDGLLEFQELLMPMYFLPQTFIERFGASSFDPATPFTHTTIESLTEFEDEYKAVIRPAALRTAMAISKAYERFRDLFDLQDPNASGIFNGFSNTSLLTNGFVQQLDVFLDDTGGSYKIGNTQYIYDYVRDVIDTYSELRQELFALLAECSPVNNVFPKHLMLGYLESRDIGKFQADDYDIPSVYRHHFIPSPAMNEQSMHYKKTLQLMRRLLMICDIPSYLDFSNLLTNNLQTEPVKILPGKTCCEPLGKRNIPFYYNPTIVPRLYRYWDYDAAVQNTSYLNRGYHAGNWQFSQQPLPDIHANVNNIGLYKNDPELFDLCKYSKLNIEGHVGKTVKKAIQELKELRARHNLSFDIIALKLSDEGRMVALPEDKIIAELQLQYLTERNEFVCCVEELAKFIDEHREVIGIGIYFMLLSLGISNTDIAAMYPYIKAVLDSYEQALLELIDSMPEDIKEFDFEKMYQIYPIVRSFTNLAKYIINTWGDVEWIFLAKAHGNLNNVLLSDLASVFLNLWESYLDRISDDCIMGKFATIYKSYIERIEAFCIFSEFNKHINGMEHIAGTNNGGTFILVYDDFDPKEDTGYIIKETGGKAVSGAAVWGNNTGMMYGYTNNKGEWKGSVSKLDDTLMFNKSGYVAVEKKLSSKSSNVKLDKYEYYVDTNKWNGNYKADPVDNIYMKIGGSMSEIKDTASNYTDVAGKFIGHITPDKVHVPVVTIDNNWEGFRVVADFYLPFPVHHHNLEIEPFDACRRFGEKEFFNYKAVVKYLQGKLKKGVDNMKMMNPDE